MNNLRELIATIAQVKEKSSSTIKLILTQLPATCFLGSLKSHKRLNALAKKILNDWDAVIAFVNNPELPPTNNEGEQELMKEVNAYILT